MIEQKCGRFFWTRMIQSYIPEFGEFTKDWKNVFEKSSSMAVKEIAYDVQKFMKKEPTRRCETWSPLHIAGENGNIDLCKLFEESLEEKNSRFKRYWWTPLHFAAQEGRFEIYKFLSENLQDINPEDSNR